MHAVLVARVEGDPGPRRHIRVPGGVDEHGGPQGLQPSFVVDDEGREAVAFA